MDHVDTLIHARWIIPVEQGAHPVLADHCLAIRNGRIHGMAPSPEATAHFRADETIHLPECALIPGLINAHTHAAMTLFRGLADDLSLHDWLSHHIWPAEAKFVGAEFVRDGTELAMAEMLRSGTTCFNDMYFFPEVTARAARSAGMRAVVGMIVIDFPSAWAADADEYLHKGLALHDELRHDPLIATAFAPHAPYSVADAALERVMTYAEELDVPVHMHIHETERETEESQARYGVRPLQRLDRLGILGPRLAAVHMTTLLPAEIERLVATGAGIVHCPESNLKLASGMCPVAALQSAGLTVALGTDGAASNNDLDLLQEMRTAALLGKMVARDPSALPAHTALRMATLDGARLLGLGEVTGSLVAGKAADLVAIDLSSVATEPVYDPISQIVYCAGREQVTDVWVAGRRLVSSGVLTTIDVVDVRARARRWRDRIWARDSVS